MKSLPTTGSRISKMLLGGKKLHVHLQVNSILYFYKPYMTQICTVVYILCTLNNVRMCTVFTFCLHNTKLTFTCTLHWVYKVHMYSTLSVQGSHVYSYLYWVYKVHIFTVKCRSNVLSNMHCGYSMTAGQGWRYASCSTLYKVNMFTVHFIIVQCTLYSTRFTCLQYTTFLYSVHCKRFTCEQCIL